MDYPREDYDGIRRYIPSFRQLLGLGVLGFLMLVALVGVAFARTDIPTPNELAAAQTSIVYFDDGKSEIGRFGAQNRINVQLSQVPDYVQKAILSAEDRSFYENNGISPSGIGRAFWNNLRGGSTQGGSTITQQYAKNAYLTHERTYTRKLKEFFIAVKLDQRDDKNQILEDYLNTIYFGRGAYGIQTAAQAYFGKDVSKLTPAEGAVLASVIRAPAFYDPKTHRDALQSRFDYVLDGMVHEGWLPAGKRAGLSLPKVKEVSDRTTRSGTRYYLLDTVRRELKAEGFSDREIDLGGLRVTATFDKQAQRSAVRAVRRERPKDHAKGVHVGLSAVRPDTGGVLAMYGGSNPGQSNEVTQARVQPGSSFKPFALTAALEDGIGLDSRFEGNSHLELPGSDKEVNNEFDRNYGSYVDLLKATKDSINTAYVDLTLEMGARKVLDAAVKAGIPADTPGLMPNARIPLGTASVRNIDMASAYGTLAAQGEATTWHTVKKVVGPNGGTLYQPQIKRSRVFDRDVMADVSYALQKVVESGTGTEALSLGRPAAGKTGTAALRPDTVTSSWFVGYTPQLSAAVDIYKGDGTKDLDGVGGLSTFFGGAYPARIWTAFMQGALEGTQVRDFPERENVGETVNPKPTPSPTPTPTTTSPSPTPTPTSSSPTPTPTAPTDTPSGSGSPSPSISIFPSSDQPSQSHGGGGNGGGGGPG